VPGAAIKISGDIRSWHESGPVEDVEITENVFDNCNYCHWGAALVDIDPEVKPGHRHAPFHRNVRIVGNEIHRFHRPLLLARCVDGLRFTDNEIHASTAYPPSGADMPDYIIEEGVTNMELQEIGE